MRLGENLGRLFLMAGSEALKLLSPTRHFEKPNFFSVLPTVHFRSFRKRNSTIELWD